MMKKILLAFLFAAALSTTGCQSEEEKLASSLENADTEYSDVLKSVLSKEWNEADGGNVYRFEKDGTGDLSGAGFTYECGFDGDNRMILQLVMDDTGKEKNYYVTTDDTGYGLYLESPEETIYILQANMELLEASDKRARGIVGEWADKSDNRYLLNEDRTAVIEQVAGGTMEGTYSVTERREDQELILTLVFDGNTLDFSYDLSADSTQMTLSSPGTDVVHEWIKIK